jgi:hypothetical protein
LGIQHENGVEAIRLRPQSIGGLRTADGYLLRLPVEYSLNAWQEKYGSKPSVFHLFSSRVELGQNRLRIGRAEAEFPVILTAHEFDQSSLLSFELELSASSIERIEEIRSGGDIELVMRINCERIGDSRTVQHDDVTFRVDQSRWIGVLGQMEYGTYLLCEIPIPLGEDAKRQNAWQTMVNARELQYAGHFSNSVVECRKALEMVANQYDVDFDGPSGKYRGNRDDRMAMTKRERILNLYSAANHATQFGAHPNVESQTVDYSRREALLIFAVVASAISEISERPNS